MLPLSHVGFTTAAVKVVGKGLRLQHIDYRLVIVSSLLPDLIDKSLEKFLGNSFTFTYESRAIGHSLAFLGIIGIFMIAQWFWKRDAWLVPVFLGTLFHDVFDVMWLHPGIFFWPLEGWQFPKPTDEAWLGTIQLGWYKIQQRDFFDNLSVLILLYFFLKIALGGKIMEFVRKGRL